MSVGAGEYRVAGYCLAIHSHETASLTHPASLRDMGEYCFYLGCRQPGLEERRALALREPGVAGATVQ